MLVDVLAAVRDHLGAAGITYGGADVDVWDEIPDDVAALPCIVVGYPAATPSSQGGGVVFTVTCVAYVISRRTAGVDAEDELVDVADQAITALGGTRGTRHGDVYLTVANVAARPVSVAGQEYDAYLVTVTSPVATC